MMQPYGQIVFCDRIYNSLMRSVFRNRIYFEGISVVVIRTSLKMVFPLSDLMESMSVMILLVIFLQQRRYFVQILLNHFSVTKDSMFT